VAHSPRKRVLLLWLLLGVDAAVAQRASLTGDVRDPSGLGVPQVQLTAVNLDQGLTRQALTDAAGGFSFLLLQPGRYVVQAQKAGFAASEVSGIELHIGDTRYLRIVLPVGSVKVSIQVTDHHEDLDTNPGLSYVVSGDTIRQAPLITRDVLDLAQLQPGVLPVNPDGLSGGANFTIAGNRNDSITFLLDGGHNNNLLDNGVTFDPNPDTISEFKILTTGYTAEYGRNGGGEISVLTKSGTKSLHGTVFEYLRNDALDANSYFNNASGLPRDPLNRNQFGVTLGGPVLLPGGKIKNLFFFVAYQGTIQDSTATVSTPTFTPAELQGDFSHSGQNGGPDPGVATFLADNPAFQPDPMQAAKAIIDPGAVDMVANAYIQHGLIPATVSGVLRDQAADLGHVNELTGKLDWEASAKQKISATLGGNRNSNASPFNFGAGSTPGFPTNNWFGDNFLNLTHLLTLKPTLLNEFRVGIQRNFNRALLPANQQPDSAALGIHINQDANTGPPILFFDSGLAVGYSPLGPQRIVNNTFSYSDTLTWIRGPHTLKFGAGLSAFQNNISNYDFFVNGAFYFSSVNSEFTGNERADFLLGFPAFYQQGPAGQSNIRSKASYVFANDEYRVRPNLLLTAGLRYEYSTPKSDTLNRTFSILPGHRSTVFPNAPVGMVFPGDPGAPTGVNFPDYTNLAPRVGFAWNPDAARKITVRAAAGLFYDILKAEDNFQFNGQEPFYSSAGVNFPGFSEPYTLQNPDPFPSQPPTASTSFSSFLPINSFGGVFVVDPHLRSPRIYQYSLSVERRVAWDAIGSLAYVGSTSRGLTALVDVNPVVLGTSDRMLNLAPGNSSCNDSASSPVCSFAAMPEFQNAANANFNSLQASVRKLAYASPAAGRSYFTLAYTYSHNIDNASGFRNRNSQVPYYHPELFRASTDFDLRHRVVFSGGWDLPLESWGSNAPRWLTTGWSLFPIVSWRSGFPLDVLANLAPSFAGDPGPSGAGDHGLVRANLVAPIQMLDPHKVQTLGGSRGNFYFDPASFDNTQYPTDAEVIANPALATYGTLPRNAFRGPGMFNINLAVAKSFALGSDSRRLELRSDFFNLLNHTEFADPVTNIGDPSQFGQIIDTEPPRIIQLSARIIF
jgi:Carboxypeptidase regulatory-like domain/TonB-dependent Receptor Plug Domain